MSDPRGAEELMTDGRSEGESLRISFSWITQAQRIPPSTIAHTEISSTDTLRRDWQR